MKTLILTLKAILLWLTAIVILTTISSIESLYNEGFLYLFGILAINIICLLACIYNIDKKEFLLLSGYTFFNKTDKIEE